MRNIFTVAGVLGLGIAMASAQPAGPPEPPAELQQLAGLVGVWKCEGTITVGGKEMVEKSKATFSWDLDRFFVAARMESARTKENPAGYKGRIMFGYDTGSKQFVSMGVDNMGGMSMLTSPGWDGDTMEWQGKSRAMGQELDAREKVTRKGPREITLAGGIGSGAQGMSWESTCRK
jgi:hypothetical protein